MELTWDEVNYPDGMPIRIDKGLYITVSSEYVNELIEEFNRSLEKKEVQN